MASIIACYTMLPGNGARSTPAWPPYAADSTRVFGGRMTYVHDEILEEWFSNGERGLEHGFTLRERPPTTARGPLTFTLRTRGPLQPTVYDEGRSAKFVAADGAAVLSYSGLVAFDADGRGLPATMARLDTGLRITVDESDARYPLTVDPLVQQTNLDPPWNGSPVAISGDTVVIGAPQEPSATTGVNGVPSGFARGSGAAYVLLEEPDTVVKFHRGEIEALDPKACNAPEQSEATLEAVSKHVSE